MNIEQLALRIYQKGFNATDFSGHCMKPGVVVVEPVRPPRLVAGIDVSAATANVPGTAALLFRVLAVAHEQPPGVLLVQAGDVVTLRQAQLDPMQFDQAVMNIKSEHLLSKWPRETEG